MVRINNINDDGYSAFRFRLFCSLVEDSLTVQIEEGQTVRLKESEIVSVLCPEIFDFLYAELSSNHFFDLRRDDYQRTRIGIVVDDNTSET